MFILEILYLITYLDKINRLVIIRLSSSDGLSGVIGINKINFT